MATLKATAMVMWIFFGATMFVGFFIVKGGQTFVANSILGTGLPPYGILVLMMVILFVLGMFIDWVGILLLTVPIFLPIMKSLEFGGLFGLPGVRPDDMPLWYGVIFMVNMQMAFLSPPFGYSLFYLKSVAPPQITMATIFRAAVHFIGTAMARASRSASCSRRSCCGCRACFTRGDAIPHHRPHAPRRLRLPAAPWRTNLVAPLPPAMAHALRIDRRAAIDARRRQDFHLFVVGDRRPVVDIAGLRPVAGRPIGGTVAVAGRRTADPAAHSAAAGLRQSRAPAGRPAGAWL